MIRLIFGNVGSGKTASMVRYMKSNPHKTFITNIHTKGKDFKHVIPLKSNMIIKKVVVKQKRTGEDVYELKLNVEFWKELLKEYKEVNVIIDEAHTILNPRRSMSKINNVVTDWMALLRRILGGTDGTGELILITQLSRRLDIIAKEMSNDIQYCICHYYKTCIKCKFTWQECNETADKLSKCPVCNDWRLKKHHNIIEVFNFTSVDKFSEFKNYGIKTHYKHYLIKDIENIFGNYDTLQFEDLLSEY